MINQRLLTEGATPCTTVYETKNYSTFTMHEFNRNIKTSKIEALKKSYSAFGQQVPILVSSKGVIFDGNHRFYACKELDMLFKFIITDEVDEDLIRNLNNTQHNWTIQDFIDSNAKKGNKNYIQVLRLSKKYGIRPAVMARTLAKQGKGTSDIKNGKMILHPKSFLESFLEYHKRFVFLRRFKDAYFMQALFEVWSTKNVDEDRLYQQIVKNMEMFEFSIPYRDAVERMRNNYNHNLKKEENMI